MEAEGRYAGTSQYVRANWPLYLFGYGGAIVVTMLVGTIAATRDWWAIVLLSLAALLIETYFLVASLWAAHAQLDYRGQRASDVLFELAGLQPRDRFVHVSLGRRKTPLALSRRLTSGRVTVIDVYNPRLAPNSALARARRQRAATSTDPRLAFVDGTIDLLPIPDSQITVVTMDRVLSEIAQRGDRRLLLAEIYRILQPGGLFVLVEPVHTPTALLAMGPSAWNLYTAAEWEALLAEVGFRSAKKRDIAGLACAFSVRKPLAGEIQQLTFDFGLLS